MANSSREQKSRAFRDAYSQGADDVEVVPSNRDLYGEDDDQDEMVGAYCRVSTMSEAQVESYELQKAYYEDMVARRPNWTLVGIYPDEGISATSMRNRKNFLRMIEDCKEGKISLIVTKSVSRFARNVVDGISVIRMLRNLPNPVAVYFETEHILTTAPGADAQLSLLASFAETESLNRSLSMKWAIRNRFAHGIPRIVDLYAFHRDKHELMPYDEDQLEYKTVQWMYQAVINGLSISRIRQVLHLHRIPSPTGKEWWPYHTILYVLTNEKYAGKVLMQKTVRVDMFLHKSVKNTGQERQYWKHHHHQAIVSIEDWVKVQKILTNDDFSVYLTGEWVNMPNVPDRKFTSVRTIPSYNQKRKENRDGN